MKTVLTRSLAPVALAVVATLLSLGGCEGAVPSDEAETDQLSLTSTSPQNGLVVVTTKALKNGSSMMDAYVAFKRQTRPTYIVTEDKTYLANGSSENRGWGTGISASVPTTWPEAEVRANAIARWLQSNQQRLGLKDVLLVGNPNPVTGDVPMKVFFIHKYIEIIESWNWELFKNLCLAPTDAKSTAECTLWKDRHDMDRGMPSDFYYSNLTHGWPIDADCDISVVADINFTQPDVNVGRIPVYDSQPASLAALDKVLSKFIAYTASQDTAWRKSALLSMAHHSADRSGEWVPFGEAIRNNILTPSGFSSYRIYEPFAPKDCNDPSCIQNVGELQPDSVVNMGSVWAGSNWSGCQGTVCSQPRRSFGLVAWAAHGWERGSEGMFNIDDSALNFLPELDDTHPAFTVGTSCGNSWPEVTNNLSSELLRTGSIGAVGANRISWPDVPDMYNPTPYVDHVGESDVTYGYMYELVVSKRSAGAALSEMRNHVNPVVVACSDAGLRRAWAAQLIMFNLYGDPTIGFTNATNPAVVTLPSDTPTNVTLSAGQTKTFFADNWPSKGNPYWTANVVLSVNSLGGKPIPAGKIWVNGVAYPIGGSSGYYQVLDIPDKGPYTIEVSITAADVLQLQLGNR